MTKFDRTMLTLNDTASDAEQVQLRLLHEKSPSERLALALRLTSEVILASKRAISRTCPELTEREVDYRFVELHYGRELAEGMKRSEETHGNGRTE